MVEYCRQLDPCTPAGIGLGPHHRLDGQGTSHLEASHFTRAKAPQDPSTPTAAHAASMAAENTEDEPRTPVREQSRLEQVASNGKDSVEHDSEGDEEDEDEAEEEPKLKYTRLTSNLGPIYRNGDATSTFMVAGDKMVWL